MRAALVICGMVISLVSDLTPCAQARLDAAKQESNQAKSERDAVKRQANELQQELQSLERSSRGGNGHPAAMWHHRAPDLLDAIQRSRNRFEKVPVGPLGMHLSILDETCAAYLVSL